MKQTKNIKSNPYVYSYVPFYNLSAKKINFKKIGKQRFNSKNLKIYLEYNKIPPLKIKGKDVSEKIFNLFLDNNIRFGPRKYIISLKDYWIKKINFFVSKNKPLHFIILGFPFKIPVPLKTNRILPDMGELLALKRLYDITQLIKVFYKKGGKITIITEEIFGTFNNMKKEEIINYQKFLAFLLKKFQWDQNLTLYPLHKMEDQIINFEKEFQDKIDELEQNFINRKKSFLKKYYGAYPSIYRITNTKRFNLSMNEFMDVYNEKKETKKKSILQVRKLIEYYTHSMLIKYLAYLELRDKFDFINKNFPNSLMLSVSPKPYRLGILPVGKDFIRLPYHGVTVFDEKNKKFSIEYFIDLIRQNCYIQEIYYEEDKEEKPFFYIKK